MYNPYSLKGKTILVTGASSGIGKATAIECSKLGADLIITGRNIENLNNTFNQFSSGNNKLIQADLINEDDVNNLVDQISNIDGLVNAAGIVKTLPFAFINKEELNQIFDTNFFSPILLTKSLIKKKKITKGSSIVFISSIDGPITTHFGNSMYSASKGAVSSVVKGMALDLSPKMIRVNAVCPGMTETPLIYGDTITNEELDSDKKLYPLKRFGKPEEIAFAVIYLLSDASSWVTGTNLVIDGGFTIQ